MTKEKIKKDEEIDILKHWIALGSFIGFMILIFYWFSPESSWR